MLVQAKESAQADLESDHDVDLRIEADVMLKLVEERGAKELFQKVRKLNEEIEDANKSLARLGFDYSYGRITFSSDAPRTLRQALEAAKRLARRENQSSLRKFDLGILGVWAAETADDARKIVEGLL